MEPAQPPPEARFEPAAAGAPASGGWREELLTGLFAAVTVTAVGLPLGLAWAHLAPHAQVAVVSRGAAQVVASEPEQFVAADFDLAGLLAALGLVAGVATFALRRGRRAPVGSLLGLAAGGVCAALVAAAVGHQVGAAGFDATLAAGRAGTLLRAPVGLRATPVLVSAAFVAVAAFGVLYWGLGGAPGSPLARPSRGLPAGPAEGLGGPG